MSPNASHRVRPGLSSAASLITTLLISFDQEVLNQHLNLVTPEYPFFESPWARARSALTGAGPGATDFFSASSPPVMKALRQNRTVSSRTPKAWAIWPLVQPDRVSKIARARSASPRSREWLRATSADLCSASALTGDLPAMIPVSNQIKRWNHGPHPLASLTTPA